MKISQARLEANRRNAAKSSGPKTEEGKIASRANALKHGMTGAGVVMFEGDAAEVDRRAEAIEDELRPSGEIGRALVRRIALHSVRMERSVIHEAATLSSRIRRAVDDFDDGRFAEVESAFAALADDPAVVLRRLRRMPEGVDRLVAAWVSLAVDLRRPGGPRWDVARGRQVDLLMGLDPAAPSASIASEVSEAILGADSGSAPARMLDLIDREISLLREHRGTLDLEAIALDRAEAPDRALFDSSSEATLARKYEAAAERGFFRSLREFRQVEAEASDRPSVPEPIRPDLRPSLGSFRPDPSPSPPIPKPPILAASIPVPRANPAAPPRPGSVTTLDFAIGRPAPASSMPQAGNSGRCS